MNEINTNFIIEEGMLHRATAVLLVLLVFAGCGGSDEASREIVPEASYRYAPKAEMTQSTIETVTKDMQVRLPAGWKETVDQKNAPNIVLWMVREDYSASLSFTPMQMNPALYKTLKKDGVSSVAKASLSMKKNNAHDSVVVIQPPERFQLNMREYVAYEYSVDKGATIIRVVVFDTGRQFMECALLPATSSISAAEARLLFETQQAVLASLSVK